MLLSLIIPIYNVEKYIEECLESVCCQLVAGVEVILVNDGTPDSSMLMARQYIFEKYTHLKEQFVFIDQENQGLSGARNTGIQHATGKYLAFLDSDDKVDPKYLTKILNIIKEVKVDIIQFEAKRFNECGKEFPFLKDINLKGVVELNDKIYENIFKNSAWFCWLRVYKKELFESLKFPLGRNFEDAYLVPKLFLNSKTAFFLEDTLIYYRENFKGITFTFSSKNLADLEWVVIHMIEQIVLNKNFSFSSVNLFFHLCLLSSKNESFIAFCKRVLHLNRLFKCNLSLVDVKSYKVKFFLLFPYLFSLLFFIKNRVNS